MRLFVRDMDDDEYSVINVAEARIVRGKFGRSGVNLMVIGVSDNMYFVNSATPPMDILEALYNDGKCTVVGNLKHAEDVLR